MGKDGRGAARRAQAARQDREHGRLRPGAAQPAAGIFPAREPETAPAERAPRASCARRNRLPRRREARGKLARAILRHAFSRCRGDGGDAEAARVGQRRGLAPDDRRKPRSGARLQAGSETGRAMKGLLWLLVLSALAVALSLAMRSHGAYALFVDRKSTRLNSSHVSISYAVFCLKKKKKKKIKKKKRNKHKKID